MHNNALVITISSLLVKYYAIDPLLQGSIMLGLTELLGNFDYNKFKTLLDDYYIFLFLIILFVISRQINFKIINYKNSTFINLHDRNDIDYFTKYHEKNPSFFGDIYESNYGDTTLIYSFQNFTNDLYSLGKLKKIGCTKEVKFNDKKFNVTGNYIWEKSCLKITDKDKSYSVDIPYLKISVTNGCAKNYFDLIKKQINETENVIMHIKIIQEKTHNINTTNINTYNYNNEYIIYQGPHIKRNELTKLFIEPFFHEQKEYLWNFIQKINDNPIDIIKLGQSPRAGYLLYGPPGTGKSSFPYRIARTLNRHIISMDLTNMRKSDVYQIIKKPSIRVKNNCHPSDVVFIFDEFDITIKKLLERQKEKNLNYDKLCEILNKELKIDDKKSLDNNSSDSKTTNNDKNYVENELNIDDLLEIFQGPVPLEGALMFATTNKFEEIQKLCPALFRHGRLTPIEFPYFDNKMMDRVCKYYFSKPWTNKNNKKYQPSFVLQKAVDSKLNNYSFEYFVKCIMEFSA